MELEEKIINNSANGEININDWTAGDLGITKNKIPVIAKGKRLPLYNQGRNLETTKACTIVNAYRDFCYQTDHIFSEIELLNIIEYCKSLKTNPFQGGSWYTYAAMNAIRNYFGNTFSYITIRYNDPLLGIVYKNNNVVGITYKGNDLWNEDSDDGILEGRSFGETTYAHRTSTVFYEGLNVVVDDSYTGSKGNIYQIPNIIKLVEEGYIYPTFYLWIPLKNTDRISELNKFKVLCQQTIDLNKKKMLYTNDIKYIDYLNKSTIKEESKLFDIKEQLLLLPK